MEVEKCIKERRSVRNYIRKPINHKDIEYIIESAIMAPSGKNKQPWRFRILTSENEISEFCDFLKCEPWVKTAGGLIFVFLDRNKSYDYIKDMQSCGAAIQNMLLTAESLGISSCWIGSVASKSEIINNYFKIDSNYELVAMVSLGYKVTRCIHPGRNEFESFLV